MLKKSCRYCGRIHVRGHVCDKKPKREERTKKHDKFRNTKAWQRKREAVRKRDLFMCRVCKDLGEINTRALEVHHIIPIKFDYERRLDETNLITLCPYCHERAERGELVRNYLFKLVKESEKEGGVWHDRQNPHPY